MDIPRIPPNRKARRVWYGAAAAGLVVLATLGLKGLKPAAPQVDLATIWVDSVQRGPLVLQVRGPGTLVPERVRWISAVTAGRVERRLAEIGQEVKPETVLLVLSNPDVQLEALESERQLTAAQGDRVNLRTSLESQRLNQQGAVAIARSEYLEAKRNAVAAESLATKDLISVEICVEDEGPGLPDAGNLFVPFFTTKEHGSGIGLVLSRQIAEAPGGSLTLEQRRDRNGARARLRLPVGMSRELGVGS